MSYKNVECEVQEPSDPFGEFANSIRLTKEGSEILMDFCVYSHTQKKARVVSRARLAQGFLPSIVEKIQDALSPPEHTKNEPHLFVMPPLNDEA